MKFENQHPRDNFFKKYHSKKYFPCKYSLPTRVRNLSLVTSGVNLLTHYRKKYTTCIWGVGEGSYGPFRQTLNKKETLRQHTDKKA